MPKDALGRMFGQEDLADTSLRVQVPEDPLAQPPRGVHGLTVNSSENFDQCVLHPLRDKFDFIGYLRIYGTNTDEIRMKGVGRHLVSRSFYDDRCWRSEGSVER